jgi:hypothetical protein
MYIKKFIKLFKAVVMDVRICFCNDFIGMANNYLVPKTYFLNSLGERLCVFDKWEIILCKLYLN